MTGRELDVSGWAGSASGQGGDTDHWIAQAAEAVEQAGLGQVTWLADRGRRVAAIVPAEVAEHGDREFQQARRTAMFAEHGKPEHYDEAAALALLQVTDVHPGQVYASRYASRAAGEAWQKANLEHFGHPSLGLAREPAGAGWIGVLDMRPAIAAAETQRPR